MRRLALVLTLLLMPSSDASAGKVAATDLFQPSEPQRGLVLTLQGRRARLKADGVTHRGFTLFRDERVLAFSELADGWVAAGIRVSESAVDLSLVADLGRGPRRLSPPAATLGPVRTAPTPVVDGESLAGLLWLEGDLGSLAVRSAAYENGSFVEIETVSQPPPSGSQTGLTAIVLADGSWLAAWSRYDGKDDEIYWARRTAAGEWGSPHRLTYNASPDVTPHLLARGSGAILAWSSARDEYEVFTASFDGDSWTPPRTLGVAGTLTPTFRRLPEADYLLVRNAWPGGWTAFRLDPDGTVADFASVAEESRRPPVLRSRPGQGLVFEWAHRPLPEELSWEPMP